MLQERVKNLLEEAFQENGSLFLISLSISDQNHISIVIDGDSGVSVNDCISVSRKIENNLENKHTLNHAIRFAEKINAKIHLVYINTVNNFKTSDETNQCVSGFIKGTNLKEHTFNVYNDVTVESGILNFAKSINAGLIGIGTHGRKGLAHFFNGSISEDLVNHAQRPVVTFKI